MNPEEDAIGVIRHNWVAAKIKSYHNDVNWFVWVVIFFIYFIEVCGVLHFFGIQIYVD